MRLRRRNVSGIKNQSDNVILTLAGLVSLLEPNDRFPRYWRRVLIDLTRLHMQPFTAALMTFIPERQPFNDFSLKQTLLEWPKKSRSVCDELLSLARGTRKTLSYRSASRHIASVVPGTP
jgi:hypothetical protein